MLNSSFHFFLSQGVQLKNKTNLVSHFCLSFYLLWEVPGLAAKELDKREFERLISSGIFGLDKILIIEDTLLQRLVYWTDQEKGNSIVLHDKKTSLSAVCVQLKHGHFTVTFSNYASFPFFFLFSFSLSFEMASVYSLGRLERHILLPLPAMLPVSRVLGLQA